MTSRPSNAKNPFPRPVHPRRGLRALLLAALLIQLPLATGAAEGDTRTVARVGERTVSGEQLRERLAGTLPRDASTDVADSVGMAAIGALVDKTVLTLEARANVRGDTATVADDLARLRREKVMQYLRTDVLDDVDLSAARQDQVYDWLGEELRVRHILCPSRNAARAINLELDRGKDFVRMARERSLDVWTKDTGGLLDWFTYGDLEGIDEVAYTLEVGEHAGPVWTPRGWHVIELVDRRARERSPRDLGAVDFPRELRELLEARAWRAFLHAEWRESGAEWVEEVLERLRGLQFRHEVTVDSLRRAHNAQVEEGDTPSMFVGPGFEVPADVAGDVVVRAGEVLITAADVARRVRSLDRNELPRNYGPDVYEHWLTPIAMDLVAYRRAIARGLSERPDVAADLANAIDFYFVQRFYDHEIERGVEPTEEDLRAFFDTHGDQYYWRPDLDLAIFRSDDTELLADARERLEAGVEFDLLKTSLLARDPSMDAVTTGMKRAFPEPAGLDQLARSLDDVEGAVSPIVETSEGSIVIRIERVGERTPMTFADAYEMVQEHCTVQLRENKLRNMLDSLQVVYDVEVDEAAVRDVARAEVGS